MGLKPKFNIDILLQEGLKYNKDLLVKSLRRIGLQAVNRARENGSYVDRTGNLRNSTGFLLSVDGVIVDSLFGNAIAQNYAKGILQEFPEEVVLIVFAGMRYASYVQSKGYDVLASAEVEAERAINVLFDQI